MRSVQNYLNIVLRLVKACWENHMKKTLQFLIDNICADFTVDSMLGLVRACITKGPATMSDITSTIIKKDRSLDVKCAEGLAVGTVQALCEAGEAEVRGASVYVTSSVARP